MLRTFLRRSTAASTLLADRDPAGRDLELRAARERALAGDWAAAREVIEAAGTRWDHRLDRIGVLSRAALHNDRWLRDWTAQMPDDPVAAGVVAALAAQKVVRVPVPPQAVAGIVADARTAAARAIALAPHDPNPWVWALWSLFAVGRPGWGDFAAALAEGLRRDPHHLSLQLTALHFLRIFGSHDQMYAFARSTAASALPGSANAMLPVLAHLDYAHENFASEEYRGRPSKVRAFFRRPEIQEELDWCVAKWRAVDPPGEMADLDTHQVQAVAYALSGRTEELNTVLAEIGPHIGDGYPWTLFFSIPSDFIRLRRQAMRTTAQQER